MTAFHDFLRALPKCEHHLHIEGTLTPELLFSLAEANSVKLPTDDDAFASPEALRARYARFSSLDDFLHYYFIGFQVLQTASDFERLTYAYLEANYAEGLRHAELFFDPQAHTERGIAYTTVVEGMAAARARAASTMPDLSVLLIPCAVRHLPVPSAVDMVSDIAAAGHVSDGTVTGFGLSSTEKGMNPARFAPVYDAARQAGFPSARLTAHYGEEGSADYVREALDVLGVTRIDHGRRVVEDPALVKLVADRRILLTLCPISNVVLRGVDRVEDVPVRALLDAGVAFSINSDDPAYFSGTLLQNYHAVHDAFALSVPEWLTIARAAIDGSWCDDARKAKLHAMVNDTVDAWTPRLQ